VDPCRPREGAVEVVGFTNSASASRRPRVLMYERAQPVAAGNRSLGLRAERNQLWPGVRRAEFERSVRALVVAMLDEDAQDPVGAVIVGASALQVAAWRGGAAAWAGQLCRERLSSQQSAPADTISCV